MRMYLNTHAGLEQLRAKAEQDNTSGPRMMIVGRSDVGKSTLSTILLNYATRIGRSPMLVDLDVGQSQLSIPGTMGASVVNSPSDVVKGFTDVDSLVLHFGHKSPSDNVQLYNQLIARLAEIVNMRSNAIPSTAGVIINTCGWNRKDGSQSLVHAARSFQVDVIIVLDQELLYNELKQHMPESVRVVQYQKSGGVVKRDEEKREQLREQKIREYFYGPDHTLYPHAIEVKFSTLKLYKIGAPTNLPASMLPLGTNIEANLGRLKPVIPHKDLTHSVLSVSAAASRADDPLNNNVLGFIVITAVNMEKEVFTVLSPTPDSLPPSICFVMEDMHFIDMK